MVQAKHPFPAEPMRVIFAKGTEREIGRQHAEAAGDWVSRGMVRFYHEFWERLLSPPEGLDGPADRLAWKAARVAVDSILSRLIRRIPAHAMERLQGVAEVSGEPIRKLQTLMVLPDLFPMLQAFLARFLPERVVSVRLPTLGCSSFVSSGERFLVGRNLDFPGVAYWDRFPAIQVTSPEGKLRYIGFTSGGVPIGGITGINEAQIYLALHQHYARPTGFRGELPFVIAEEVLGRARTLDEAREILERTRVVTAWAFVVVDGKRRDGFVLETHAGGRGLRRLGESQGRLTHTNFFQTTPCRPAEYAATARMNWDNASRNRRMGELLAGEGHFLTPAKAATVISDHFDPYWREEKVFNRTVSQVFNIQSLLVDPVAMTAWIAEGDAPIHLGSYREVDLGALFAGRDGLTETRLPGYRFADPRKDEAKRRYILSFIESMDGKLEAAWEQLKLSLDAHFVPEGALTGAVVSLKLGDFERAVTLLETAIGKLEKKISETGLGPPPEYHECRFFLARALDLLGRRSESLPLYRALSRDTTLEDDNLRRICLKEEPYTKRGLAKILAPYSAYIPFQ